MPWCLIIFHYDTLGDVDHFGYIIILIPLFVKYYLFDNLPPRVI